MGGRLSISNVHFRQKWAFRGIIDRHLDAYLRTYAGNDRAHHHCAYERKRLQMYL